VLAALDAARCGGDPVVLADALSLAHHCLLGPEHADRRLNLADELLAVAGLTGRTMDSVLGLLWRTVDLLLAADPHAQRSLRELAFVVAWSLPNTRKVYLNDYPANVFEGGGCGLLGIAGVGIDAHEGAVMTRWGERMNAAIAAAARTFAGDPSAGTWWAVWSSGSTATRIARSTAGSSGTSTRGGTRATTREPRIRMRPGRWPTPR
jgi:hypothetical protein